MSVETELVSQLTGDSTVSGLVSSRVYPLLAPQGATLPCVVYEMTAHETINSTSGAGSTRHAQVEVLCLDDSYGGTKTLADAVRDALNGWTVSDSVTVSSCLLTSESDGFVQPNDDSEQPVYLITQEYSIWFS